MNGETNHQHAVFSAEVQQRLYALLLTMLGNLEQCCAEKGPDCRLGDREIMWNDYRSKLLRDVAFFAEWLGVLGDGELEEIE